MFSIVFGEEWRMAGELARWLTPWLLVVFIAGPLTRAFTLSERNGEMLAFEAVFLILRLVAIFGTAIYTGSFLVTVIVFSLVSTAFWIIYLTRSLSIAGASKKRNSNRSTKLASGNGADLHTKHALARVRSDFVKIAAAVLGMVVYAVWALRWIRQTRGT